VSGLLETVGLAGRPVVVERNGAALFPREFPVTRLEEGDRVEIVRVVAGG
jgi:sulfur carrier protein